MLETVDMWNARSSQPRSLKCKGCQLKVNKGRKAILQAMIVDQPAAREGVALHETVGVQRQQLHALRQDQLSSAAWACAVFPVEKN